MSATFKNKPASVEPKVLGQITVMDTICTVQTFRKKTPGQYTGVASISELPYATRQDKIPTLAALAQSAISAALQITALKPKLATDEIAGVVFTTKHNNAGLDIKIQQTNLLSFPAHKAVIKQGTAFTVYSRVTGTNQGRELGLVYKGKGGFEFINATLAEGVAAIAALLGPKVSSKPVTTTEVPF